MEPQQISFDLIEQFIESYKACGLDKTREYDFLLSIMTSKKMPRGGGLGWLSSIISRGLPTGYVQLGNELAEYAEKSHRKDVASTLQSFATRLKTGYPLTERQMAYAEALKQQVVDAKPDIQLDTRQSQLYNCFVSSFRRGQYYWSNRPGTSSRLEKIFQRMTSEFAISQDDWDTLKNNFKSITQCYEKASTKHPVGSLRWLFGLPVTVMSDTKIGQSSKVVVDVLDPKAGIVEAAVIDLKIRAPSKRAAA